MKFAYLIEPPFNFLTAEGQVTGTDVELAKVVLTQIGIDNFDPIETQFAQLLPGLVSGQWRMTTGLFATRERKQFASFSRPIWALPDGLLVPLGNPRNLSGYRSVAKSRGCRLAVVRDQIQHRSAVEFGVNEDCLIVFETYTQAANAVINEKVDAYASVGRAHLGYIDLNPNLGLDVITVPRSEKEPAFGSFAFNKDDNELREDVDGILSEYLGSAKHRSMMNAFGFNDKEISLVVDVE